LKEIIGSIDAKQPLAIEQPADPKLIEQKQGELNKIAAQRREEEKKLEPSATLREEIKRQDKRAEGLKDIPPGKAPDLPSEWKQTGDDSGGKLEPGKGDLAQGGKADTGKGNYDAGKFVAKIEGAGRYLASESYYYIDPVKGSFQPVKKAESDFRPQNLPPQKEWKWVTQTPGPQGGILIPPGYIVAGIQSEKGGAVRVLYDKANRTWRVVAENPGTIRVGVIPARPDELDGVQPVRITAKDAEWRNDIPEPIRKILESSKGLSDREKHIVIQRIITSLFMYSTSSNFHICKIFPLFWSNIKDVFICFY
jgi:hypothetical protein